MTPTPNTADLYNPATGTFTPTSSMHDARVGFAATRLPDGRVLVEGGVNNTARVKTAEIYDPGYRRMVRHSQHETAALGALGHPAQGRHGAGKRWQHGSDPLHRPHYLRHNTRDLGVLTHRPARGRP